MALPVLSGATPGETVEVRRRGAWVSHKVNHLPKTGEISAERTIYGGKRIGDPVDITDEDDRAFAAHVLETYFRVVGEGIRKAAPHHLILGSRLHGMAMRNPDLFRIAGSHVDVISVNYYHTADDGITLGIITPGGKAHKEVISIMRETNTSLRFSALEHQRTNR